MASPTVANAIANQTNVELDEISIDVSNVFADTDDTESISWSVSGLPAGTALSINAATGVLSGTPNAADIAAAPYSVIVTCTDTSGNSLDTTFTIKETADEGGGETPPPPTPEESIPNGVDNWPAITCCTALGNPNTAMTIQPWKDILAGSTWFVHQGSGITNTANRAVTKANMQGLRDINPNLHIVMHMNLNDMEVDAGSTSANAFLMDLAHADSANIEKWIATDGTNRLSFRHKRAKAYARNWGYTSGTMNQDIVDKMVEHWTDGDNSNTNDVSSLQLHIMQDTFYEYTRPIWHKSEIDDSTITLVNQKEFDIPTWSGMPVVGGDIGNGYQALDGTYHAIILKANGTNSSWKVIEGVKTINGSTTRVKLTANPSFTIATGDKINIYQRSGGSFKTRAVDFNDNGTANTDPDGNDITARQTGAVDLFTKFKTDMLAHNGIPIDAICNGGNTGALHKEDGIAPTTDGVNSLWDGFWGAVQCERFAKSANFGFFQEGDTHYTTGNNGFVFGESHKGLSYAKRWLQTEESSSVGYPALWLNAQLRAIPYANLNELDAAFARFICCYCWSMTYCAPHLELDTGHKDPYMIDERIISLGSPTSARDWGTYDPTGNSDTGSYVLDAADFGTAGYIKEFENAIIVINCASPGKNVIWVPHWMSGGQTLQTSRDRATLPDPGAGNKFQRFQRDTYTNPDTDSHFFGRKANEYNASFPGHDATWNDGSDAGVAGDTIDVGPLESIILLKVPA